MLVLNPLDDEMLSKHEISGYVGNVRNNYEDLLKPLNSL